MADSGWRYGVLGDVVDKGSSNISLRKIKNDDGPFPVFGAKGHMKNVSFYHQENEYLAIIKDGAGIGRVTEHPSKSSVLATMQYLLPKEGFDIRFIKYFIESIDFDEYRTGSTIPHIYFKDYKSAPLPLVSAPEQKRIVAILDQAFSDIELARAKTEKSLKNARELFESYLQQVFSQRGDGWVDAALFDHVKFIDYRGRTPKKTESGLKLITAKNVRMGFIKTDPEEFVAPESYDGWMTRGIPRKGDVLFTTEAPLANVAQLNTDEKVVFAQRIITMQPDREVINNDFLKYMLMSKPLQVKIHEKGTGATCTGIKASLLKKIPISFPETIEEQSSHVVTLDALNDAVKSLESIYQRKLSELDELKKSILQKAFAGELTNNDSKGAAA